MKYLIPFLIAFTISVFPQNVKQIKLFINDNLDQQKANSLSIDLEHSIIEKEGGLILFADETEFQVISNSGLNYEILIDDWKAYYKSLPVPSEMEKEIIKMESQIDFGVTGFDFGSMGGYYTLAEIEANLDEMFSLYPNLITQKFSIGTSVEGRTIWAVKISDNPNVNESEPAVGFDALVHAREPQSMATQMYFIWYLLENYGTDPEATYLVNNREIYCVPCFNVDGYEYNHLTDPNGGGNWRKNRRNNGGGCYGVDLNRNFGYKWGYDNLGSSPDPCASTYRGPSAFSEPESQAIRDLAILKNYGTHFNMHTHGGYILYPWGYIDEETPDSLTYREFAALLTSYSGYTYGYGGQLLGYNSNGSIRDWMYGEQTIKNKIYGYTIEIGNAFWPSQSQIFPIAQQNLRTMIYQAFLAGEYVQLVDPNFSQEFFLPGDDIGLLPEFRNKGLATAHNLTFELTSPSQYVTINVGSASMDSIEARTSNTISTPMLFDISTSAPLEAEIPLVLTTRINGDVISSDTNKIIIGFPIFIFEDDSNNPSTYWTITKTPTSSPQWDSTYKSFYSAPNSYTDSKNGNYINNATVTMTLTDPIDLSGYINPRLQFQTKYNIESDWDYGQVQVSTNNGTTWIALEGEYTQPGVGSFQPPGEPVYDGSKSDWVKEDISIANYISSQFKIRFRLRTDTGINADGWYLDDIGVFIYTIPTAVSSDEVPVYQFSLDQNYPNPFNPSTKIKYSVPSVIASETKQSQLVTLKVYDILGNQVATLINEEKPSGEYEVDFDAAGLSSGIYFYKLQAGSFVATKKMILLR
ncbi:MAG: M14 family zinc carboxypeptidase [Ignavibacteriaceae bacterium]|nr:M14 family zinc carboxypeptidase [Ignavibacteriaceae bacterium]